MTNFMDAMGTYLPWSPPEKKDPSIFALEKIGLHPQRAQWEKTRSLEVLNIIGTKWAQKPVISADAPCREYLPILWMLFLMLWDIVASRLCQPWSREPSRPPGILPKVQLKSLLLACGSRQVGGWDLWICTNLLASSISSVLSLRWVEHVLQGENRMVIHFGVS